MNPLRFTAPVLFALLALAEPLAAQTNRSTSTNTSSANRTSTTSRNTNASRGSTGGSSSSSGGSRQYRSNTMLGDATIQVDPESRSVVVVTDEKTHAEMMKVIEQLDHPKPQVLIKVVFVEVTLNKDLDVGLEGSYTFKVGNGVPITTGSGSSATTTNTNGIATIGSLFGLASTAGGAGTVAAVAASNWSATLHALESRGNLRILSRPSIMARNNQEAVIVVGQEVPLITSSQTTDTGVINNSIQYRDVGIILRVTPFITADKTVEMIVNPEISSLSDKTVAISSGVSAPVINKRSAETVVVTPNATTVVIGGMMQKQDISTVSKVPILGDIPILGLPFRHTVKSQERTELMIFLTPFIVDGPSKLKALTVSEANKSELTREAFTPEDIKKNLEPLLLLPVEDALPPAKGLEKSDPQPELK